MKNSRIVYYDSFSIVVINSKSKLRKLYCPFMVECIKTTNDIQNNSFVYVDEVYCTTDQQLLYKIHGKIYNHRNFTIKNTY